MADQPAQNADSAPQDVTPPPVESLGNEEQQMFAQMISTVLGGLVRYPVFFQIFLLPVSSILE
jgi:hypothetical protein